MAKQKVNVREMSKNYENVTLSSGVTIKVKPFPPGLYESIETQSYELYPDPIPPKKTIETVTGPEEIEDTENEEYKEQLQEAINQRSGLLGEAIIDFCIEIIDFEKWESTIKRLEKYSGKYPEDSDEKRIKFLTDFALRTKGDYEIVMVTATTQTMIDDPEVQKRIEFFRSEVERAKTNNLKTSSLDEDKRVDV